MAILEFRLDAHSPIPMYRQIVDHVRYLVAVRHLQPGDRLPTVRDFAVKLGVHQNTVSRAFQQLEQERVIASRRGAGTIVTITADDPVIATTRQQRLDDIFHRSILTVLSLGYSPEEAETSFRFQMSHWQEERNGIVEVPPDVTEIKKQKR